MLPPAFRLTRVSYNFFIKHLSRLAVSAVAAKMKSMSAPKPDLAEPNQQGLDIRATPRAEMQLYPLDTFPYEFPGREIKIHFEMPEFTCICPFSDFPDFATIRLDYVPNEHCIDLKTLKLYTIPFPT